MVLLLLNVYNICIYTYLSSVESKHTERELLRLTWRYCRPEQYTTEQSIHSQSMDMKGFRWNTQGNINTRYRSMENSPGLGWLVSQFFWRFVTLYFVCCTRQYISASQNWWIWLHLDNEIEIIAVWGILGWILSWKQSWEEWNRGPGWLLPAPIVQEPPLLIYRSSIHKHTHTQIQQRPSRQSQDVTSLTGREAKQLFDLYFFLSALLCRWLLSEVGASRSVGGWEGGSIRRNRRGTDLPGSLSTFQVVHIGSPARYCEETSPLFVCLCWSPCISLTLSLWCI